MTQLSLKQRTSLGSGDRSIRAVYFFPDRDWSSLGGFLGLLLCFCFAPAFKDENVVSDACQRTEEIHEQS